MTVMLMGHSKLSFLNMDSTWAYEMKMLMAPKPFWSLDALQEGH